MAKKQFPKLKHFKEKEVVDPLFDGNPYMSWRDMPVWLKERHAKTLIIVDAIREFIGVPIRINSGYRPKSKGSAHCEGKAFDLQFTNPKNRKKWLKVVDWLLSDACPFIGFRVILEWQGKEPWLHIDTDFKVKPYEKKAMVAFPVRGKMVYRKYEGKLPMEYV